MSVFNCPCDVANLFKSALAGDRKSPMTVRAPKGDTKF